MSTGTIITIVLVIALVPAFIAKVKGGSFFLFYLLGALLWPLAMLAVIVMKDQNWRCKACRKKVDPKATICPYCRTSFVEAPEVVSAS